MRISQRKSIKYVLYTSGTVGTFKMRGELTALAKLIDNMRLPVPLKSPLRRVDSDLFPHPGTPGLLCGESFEGSHRRGQSLPKVAPSHNPQNRYQSAVPPRKQTGQALSMVVPTIRQDPRYEQARQRRETLETEKRFRLQQKLGH